MPIIVKVKARHQITLPLNLRREIGIEIGDPLIATVERGRLVLTPQHLLPKDPVVKLSEEERQLLR